jgi:hypothetical protein
MIFAILLIVIGLVLALAVPHIAAHVVGWVLVAVGVILLLLAFLPADADAALLIPFGPHAARLLRWAAGKLDPRPESNEWDGSTLDTAGTAWATTTGTKPTYTVSPNYCYSWPKPGDPARN